jgi:hypothetical protein
VSVTADHELVEAAAAVLDAAAGLAQAARREDCRPAVPDTLLNVGGTLALLASAVAAMNDELRRTCRLSNRTATAAMEAIDDLNAALRAARQAAGPAHRAAAALAEETAARRRSLTEPR